MLSSKVVSAGWHLTAHPGSSHPIAVSLESRKSRFFKSFVGQSVTMCAHYKQDPFEVPLNEVIAWRLAHAMGPPWMQMVPTAVLRKINGKGGALINQRHGPPDPTSLPGSARAGGRRRVLGRRDRQPRPQHKQLPISR